MIKYVFDTNIVIKLWDEHPVVLDLLEAHEDFDYVVTNEVLQELVNGELDQFLPKPSPKYLQIIKHISNSNYAGEGGRTKTPFLITHVDGEPEVFIGNRITNIDLSTIMYCQNNPEYFLVTDDEKMLKSAGKVLGIGHVLNFDMFLEQLQSSGLVE